MDEMAMMHVLRLEAALNILADVNPDFLKSEIVPNEHMAKLGITESDMKLLHRLLSDIKEIQRTASLLSYRNKKLIHKMRMASRN